MQKMEAMCFSETSVSDYKPTSLHDLQDYHTKDAHFVSLKTYITILWYKYCYCHFRFVRPIEKH